MRDWRKDRRTDGRTEWNQYTPPPPPTSLCGGYKDAYSSNITITTQNQVTCECNARSYIKHVIWTNQLLSVCFGPASGILMIWPFGFDHQGHAQSIWQCQIWRPCVNLIIYTNHMYFNSGQSDLLSERFYNFKFSPWKKVWVSAKAKYLSWNISEQHFKRHMCQIGLQPMFHTWPI